MGKIKLTINNRQVEAYEGKTILEVAREMVFTSLLCVI